MSDIIIGILLVISFFFMVWYCVKGYKLDGRLLSSWLLYGWD